jgi:type III secretion protein W
MDRKTFRSHFNFEILAKLFFDIAEERYPSSEKMRQYAAQLINPLPISPLESLYIQIGVLNIMRDMVKEVAPAQLYRSIQHRDDLYLAIIEALEDLEDELEDLEDKMEEEEEYG